MGGGDNAVDEVKRAERQKHSEVVSFTGLKLRIPFQMSALLSTHGSGPAGPFSLKF